MTNHDEIKNAIRNELATRLPEVAPGLTKSAYEQIIEETIEAFPKHFDEFEKAAAAGSPLPLGTIFRSEAVKGAAGALGGAAVAALAGATLVGLRGAFKTVQNNSLRPAFEEALKICMKDQGTAGEIIRSAPAARVRSYAETIFGIAPHVASDPNLLKGVLASAVQGESIDLSTTRSLIELEEKRKNLGSFKPRDFTI